MNERISRRGFVKNAALVSAGAVGGAALSRSSGQAMPATPEAPAPTPIPTPAEPMPMGRIKGVEFSRLMLGGNLVSGYAHSRDLSYVAHLMKRYNTETKITETLELAEAHGINSINLTVWDKEAAVLEKHWKRGGKIKLIAQALPGQLAWGGGEKGDLDQFKRAVDMGAAAVHLQGHGTEKLWEDQRLDVIARIVDFVKSQKCLVGVAAHSLDALRECVTAKLDVDFYQKTLHTHQYYSSPRPDETGFLGKHDNSWCNDPEEVVDFMHTVDKPWIAFKVMAAGAIPPQPAFQHAFNSGADFVLAGMFDWQIEDDVDYARQALAGVRRTRPWRA
ncbi:MAG: twin-arginine translocation signal domain-containing protein [Limisphaerales bacterium]